MSKHALILLAALALSPAAVMAQNAATPTDQAAPAATTEAQAQELTPADFAMRAAVSNLFELETSTAALERATREDVKAFAQMMVDDHTKAAQGLAPAADAEGVTLPTSLDEAHQQQADDLNGLEGEDFDNAYVAAQVKAHEEAVALFSGYTQSGSEGALKEFAVATLPTLEEHLAHIKEIAGQ